MRFQDLEIGQMYRLQRSKDHSVVYQQFVVQKFDKKEIIVIADGMHCEWGMESLNQSYEAISLTPTKAQLEAYEF